MQSYLQDSDKLYRPSFVEIELNKIRENVEAYKKLIPAQADLIAVVKADGYGHGAIQVLKAAMQGGASWAAVSLVEEAIDLRKSGYELPILALGSWYSKTLPAFFKYGITPLVYSIESAEMLNRYAKNSSERIKVHLKLDTGMSRMGFSLEGLELFLKNKDLYPYLEVDGVMSHFSSADEGKDEFTLLQINQFKQMLNRVKEYFSPTYVHIANTAGMTDFPDVPGNIFRLGIGLYGLEASDKLRLEMNLKPALKWKTAIGQIKWLPEETPVSYGRTYITKRKTKVGVISVGYADGYFRALSNKAFVLVAGRRAPVIGNICMDMCMIDLTDIPEAKLYDEVVLLGKQGNEVITACEIAKWAGTINYEIVCAISKRVPRYYL